MINNVRGKMRKVNLFLIVIWANKRAKKTDLIVLSYNMLNLI